MATLFDSGDLDLTHSPTSPLRIMLVEDRTLAAITLECLIEDLGHLVTAVAATPAGAERELRHVAPNIDLVIFDALLVGMPSLRLAETLRRHDLPAIVTSTMPEADVRALGFKERYLAQPFTDLNVGRLLGRAREARIAA